MLIAAFHQQHRFQIGDNYFPMIIQTIPIINFWVQLQNDLGRFWIEVNLKTNPFENKINDFNRSI